MPGHFERFVKKPLRQMLYLLLKGLEDKSTRATPRMTRIGFWQRDRRIPSWLVGIIVGGMLFGVLFLELGPGLRSVLGLLLLTGMLFWLFVIYLKNEHPALLMDEEAVALLGFLVVAGLWMMELWCGASRLFEWVSPYGMPLAAISMLTALLLEKRLAIVVTLVLSVFCGLVNEFSLESMLVACFGGMTAVARSITIRARRDITRAGFWIILAQGATIAVLALLQEWSVGQALFALAWAVAGGGLSVLGVLAILPSLENFFSRLTNMKLLELADVNHPLLKRMSLEAPGTYHHSLIMASLAEAAAEAVGANGLLCRVGAYYHDIGKMVKPEYFVENQGALGNPHDPLPPNLSNLVIQSHVKEGVALARQYNLDRAIVDFIVMHHGTSRIEYFYRRAIEQSPDIDEVGEDDYRYPGPKPHSRETAILMMADSIEATVRTLEEPTHQRIQDQVKKIINGKIADNQMDDVPLTLSNMHKIEESFVNTLAGIYHARIRYPDQESPSGGPEASIQIIT